MYRKIEHIETDDVKYIWTALVPFVDRITCGSFPLPSSQVKSRLLSGEFSCWIVTEYEVIQSFGLYQHNDKDKTIDIIGISGTQNAKDDVFASLTSQFGYIHTSQLKNGEYNE